MKYFLRFRSIWSYMLDLPWIVWIYTDLYVCHAIWWIYYASCEYKFTWLVYFIKFVFFLHMWYFCYLLCNFCPNCMRMWNCDSLYFIMRVDMWACIYFWNSDINLRTPFGDEYICGLQTHLRIIPLLDSFSLVFRDELWYLFQLLLLFRAYISDLFCFYSPGVVYI